MLIKVFPPSETFTTNAAPVIFPICVGPVRTCRSFTAAMISNDAEVLSQSIDSKCIPLRKGHDDSLQVKHVDFTFPRLQMQNHCGCLIKPCGRLVSTKPTEAWVMN